MPNPTAAPSSKPRDRSRAILVFAFALALAVCGFAGLAKAAPPAIDLLGHIAASYYSPLTLSEAQKAQTAPISDTETATTDTISVGTTAAALFTSPGDDLGATLRLSTVVQNLRITNRSTSATLCVWYKTFTTDCTTTCTAAPKTCDGSVTDGEPVLASSSYTAPITGTLACVCGRASAVGTTTTSTRVVRDREK